MATLLGDATLTTTTSISDFDTVVGTNNANKQQVTGFRKPRATTRIETSDLIRRGVFLPLTDRDTARLIGMVDPDYAQEDSFEEIPRFGNDPTGFRNITYNTIQNNPAAGPAPAITTDRFIFDFNEIREIVTTDIDRVQIKLTVTTGKLYNTSSPFSEVSSGTINVTKDNFAPTNTSADTYGGAKTLNAESTQTFTFDTDDADTPSVTFIGSGSDGHGGSFLPFNIAFSTDKIAEMTIDSVEMQLTYTGKTLLPGPYIKNDSLTYTAKDGSDPDSLSFNWNAGNFNTPANNLVAGVELVEYINLASRSIGSTGPAGSSGFVFVTVEGGQYTITQDGSDKGAVLPNTTRQWQADVGDGGYQAGGAPYEEPLSGLDAHDSISKPNILVDQTIANIDRSDITTSFNMKVPYVSADTTPAALNQEYNIGSLPNSLQTYMRFLFAPGVLGAGALDSVFSSTVGVTGVKHGLASSDIATQASSFTQDGQGGFLLEGAASISGAMSFGINAGFQLSITETDSSAFTMVVSAATVVRASATVSSAFTLVEDVDLFVQTELSVNSSFTQTAGPAGLGVIHSLILVDIGILPSSVTATAVGTSLPGPAPARTFVLSGAETRTITLNTETRTIETVTQTSTPGNLVRAIRINTETRTLPVEQQTRILTIKGYSG